MSVWCIQSYIVNRYSKSTSSDYYWNGCNNCKYSDFYYCHVETFYACMHFMYMCRPKYDMCTLCCLYYQSNNYTAPLFSFQMTLLWSNGTQSNAQEASCNVQTNPSWWFTLSVLRLVTQGHKRRHRHSCKKTQPEVYTHTGKHRNIWQV